jgi:hypothetical protein
LFRSGGRIEALSAIQLCVTLNLVPNVRFVPKADIVGADKLAFARIPQFNSGAVGADTAL